MTKSRRLSQREARMWQKVAKSVRRLETRHEPQELPVEPTETDVSRENIPEKQLYQRPKAGPDDLKRLTESGFVPTPKASKINAQTKRHPPSHGLADRGREKKVRRGKFDIGPSLDLHGHTQDSAKAALFNFVRVHQSREEPSLLVITGKGRAGGGVLRQRFLEWIAEPQFRVLISGFSQAHQKHGGEGAFYLFLRKTRP